MTSNGLLILDLPPKTFVGINLTSFTSSPHFHGIVNLPTGLHFLYTGTDASLSIRSGRWLKISTEHDHDRFHVLKWSHEHEFLELLSPTSTEASSAISSVGRLQGKGLIKYTALLDASSDLQLSQAESAGLSAEADSNDEHTWSTLTSYISPATLSRILATGDNQSSPLPAQSWSISSISSAAQDAETIPGLEDRESHPVLQDAGASQLNFVAINLKQTWPDDSVGRDRTEKARDKSWYLGHLISVAASSLKSRSTTQSENDKRQRGAKELLAELQFCFVMVLTLANYSALEQWKRILSVMLDCKSALVDVQVYFVEVIKVLQSQLHRVEDVEGGLFELADDVGNQWLRQLLKGFRNNVDEVVVVNSQAKGEDLEKTLKELEEWLREKYGWAEDAAILKRGMVELEDGERVELEVDGLDEEEESGEYAPVVVEM